MKKYIIALAVLAGACTTTKKSAMKGSDDIKTISFGNGGGVTGAWTQYALEKNGDLQKTEGRKPAQALSRVDAKIVDGLFAEAAQVKAAPYNKPGNITQFVDIVKADTTYHFAWTIADPNVDTAVLTLYKKLMVLAR